MIDTFTSSWAYLILLLLIYLGYGRAESQAKIVGGVYPVLMLIWDFAIHVNL